MKVCRISRSVGFSLTMLSVPNTFKWTFPHVYTVKSLAKQMLKQDTIKMMANFILIFFLLHFKLITVKFLRTTVVWWTKVRLFIQFGRWFYLIFYLCQIPAILHLNYIWNCKTSVFIVTFQVPQLTRVASNNWTLKCKHDLDRDCRKYEQ